MKASQESSRVRLRSHQLRDVQSAQRSGGSRRLPLISLGLLGSAFAGCVGNVGDKDKGVTNPSGEEIPSVTSVGGHHLMRLTSGEYNTTVQDLLGTKATPASTFNPDEKVGPFDANVLAPPSEVMLEDYLTAAESLAVDAVKDLAGLTGCTDDLGTEACAHSFIDTFGERAYRRPLTPEQRERLRDVYAQGKELDGFSLGIELVVRAVLQSPYFLYRVEVGEPVADLPGIAKLDNFEVASRLSYFLWDSMPDPELFAAAKAGGLATEEGIEAHARRMLASDRAKPTIGAFHMQWMGLGATLQKDSELFPEVNDSMVESMRQETSLFAADVVASGDGKLSTLFNAPYTFVDAPLAKLYGVEHQASDPAEFIRVDLDPSERAGLLTRVGVLSATSHVTETSVVLRGKFLRAFVLCSPLPPPPADVDVSDNSKDRTSPSCINCHERMDPMGQGLEHYDAIGRYREADGQGRIVDTDVAGSFYGGIELSAKFAQSKEVRECVARQWFRFALGRPEDIKRDVRTLYMLDQAFVDGDIRELIVAMTRTDAFRFRAVEVP